jgi:hypothetical protein
MNHLDYHAERIGDYGNITGSGLGNLMGAPELGPIELLVREAVQNSWDARLETSTEIDFGVEYRVLSGAPLDRLQHQLFRSHPSPLLDMVTAPELSVIIVSDRKTRGLAGPIRPTEEADHHSDFINFVYMIGETKPVRGHDGVVSGGTYGYGRSSFFRASNQSTIVVHTRANTGTGPESRLIAISWLGKYSGNDGELFTGRHWWGRRYDSWVGPVTGDAADDIARDIGMPPFDGDDTGTTIMVLDPAISIEDENEHTSGPGAGVVSSILWNCWPRMLAGGINFEVTWNGQPVVVPDPRSHPRLKAFTKAFDVLEGIRKGSSLARAYPIKSHSPKQHLGDLGISRVPFIPSTNNLDAGAPVSSDEPLRHIALMRNTMLVLKYLRAAASPLDREQYAGLFVTDSTVDNVFARAEPPSHDDWVKERLETRNERIFVNVALRRIQEKAKDFVAPAVTGFDNPGDTRSFARLADELGSLLPGLEETAEPGDSAPSGKKNRADNGKEGGGARGNPGGRGGGNTPSGRSKPRAQLEQPTRQFVDGHIRLDIPFTIDHRGNNSGARVAVAIEVQTAGGGYEGSPPDDAAEPEVTEWTIGDQITEFAKAGSGRFEASVPHSVGAGRLTVLQPADCKIRISVSARPLEDSPH